MLPFERPYVVAHEWGHLAGFADESEASFVGWLTCLAGDEASRYSAWLYLSPQLVRHLGEEERSRVWGRLAPGPATDLRAVAARTREAVPIVRRNANRVYDQYLKANRVEAGVASYGAIVGSRPGEQGVLGHESTPSAPDGGSRLATHGPAMYSAWKVESGGDPVAGWAGVARAHSAVTSSWAQAAIKYRPSGSWVRPIIWRMDF